MIRARLIAAASAVTLIASVAATNSTFATDRMQGLRAHAHKTAALDAAAPLPSTVLSDVTCTDGSAGPFPCDGIDLLAFVPLSTFAGTELPRSPAELSDIWGWTDPESGDEYVIVGKTNGASFFRVTDPTEPVYLGDVINVSGQRIWHDIKVFENRAYIVSESHGHQLKVFDLTRLRDVTAPQMWLEDARYPLNISAHNIALNEETGTAFIVGGSVGGVAPDHCNQGLHIVDVRDVQPVPVGCYITDGYIHDTQCVIYRGPDEEYTGREICFNSSEDVVSIVDVTDRLLPRILGFLRYPKVGYTHQGWLTEDHGYFLLGDEQDETGYGMNTRTVIIDVRDLNAPVVAGEHVAGTSSIDHNMYIRDGLVYQSNYTAGLRVLDVSDVADGVLTEVAFFDTYPDDDKPIFKGTWSNYPFFSSGTIAVSSINEGLFLLRRATG